MYSAVSTLCTIIIFTGYLSNGGKELKLKVYFLFAEGNLHSHHHQCTMATNAISGDVDVFSPTSLWSRPDSVDDDITFSQTKSSISTWKSDNIDEWLESVGLMKHSSLLRDQGITSGSVLLQLTEDHLKEMGLSLIGERIAFMNGVDKLRLEAGYYPTAKFFDGDYFLEV